MNAVLSFSIIILVYSYTQISRKSNDELFNYTIKLDIDALKAQDMIIDCSYNAYK